MNVSLTPQLEKLVKDEIRSSRYSSASEVVRDALRLLQDRRKAHQQRLEGLRREISVGIRKADNGETIPFDDKTTASMPGASSLPISRDLVGPGPSWLTDCDAIPIENN